MGLILYCGVVVAAERRDREAATRQVHLGGVMGRHLPCSSFSHLVRRWWRCPMYGYFTRHVADPAED